MSTGRDGSLNAKCLPDNTCLDSNAFCNQLICKCREDYFERDGQCGKLSIVPLHWSWLKTNLRWIWLSWCIAVEKVGLGQPCSSGEVCAGHGTQCNSQIGRCVCSPGYYKDGDQCGKSLHFTSLWCGISFPSLGLTISSLIQLAREVSVILACLEIPVLPIMLCVCLESAFVDQLSMRNLASVVSTHPDLSLLCLHYVLPLLFNGFSLFDSACKFTLWKGCIRGDLHYSVQWMLYKSLPISQSIYNRPWMLAQIHTPWIILHFIPFSEPRFLWHTMPSSELAA